MKGNATMKIKKYSAYKDSGIEWIGDIPEHWEVTRSKWLWKEVNVRSKDGLEQLLSVSQYDGVRLANVESRSESLGDYKIVKENDLVMNIMLVWLGGLGVSQYNGLVSPSYAVYRPLLKIYELYFHFLYRTTFYLKEFAKKSTGVVPSRWRLYSDAFGDIYTILPPLSEQKKIASFLDKKTAEIDKAIELKQKENELLKEHRQITINQAVTRGLNPNVPLKDSGIEWIGDIPEHWEVRKLKYLAKVNPTRNDRLIIKYINEDVVNLPMEKISEKWEVDQSLFASTRSLMSGLTYFEKNDILLAKITPCFENGKGAYLDQLKTEMGFGTTELHVIRSKDNTTQCFLSYVLRSYMFKELATINMIGTAGQKRVSSFFLSNYIFTYPPLSEQKEISAYLEEVDKETNRLIELNHRAIEKLKEYKQVLIDQAVRGEICLV